MGDMGRIMMLIGAGIFVIGALMTFAGRLPWFGQLPGDIVMNRGNVTFFMPIGSMIVISLLLTVVINVALRLFR